MNLRKFQASNGKFTIRNIRILPYKEICWQKCFAVWSWSFTVYPGTVEKDHLTINTIHDIVYGCLLKEADKRFMHYSGACRLGVNYMSILYLDATFEYLYFKVLK